MRQLTQYFECLPFVVSVFVQSTFCFIYYPRLQLQVKDAIDLLCAFRAAGGEAGWNRARLLRLLNDRGRGRVSRRLSLTCRLHTADPAIAAAAAAASTSGGLQGATTWRGIADDAATLLLLASWNIVLDESSFHRTIPFNWIYSQGEFWTACISTGLLSIEPLWIGWGKN